MEDATVTPEHQAFLLAGGFGRFRLAKFVSPEPAHAQCLSGSSRWCKSPKRLATLRPPLQCHVFGSVETYVPPVVPFTSHLCHQVVIVCGRSQRFQFSKASCGSCHVDKLDAEVSCSLQQSRKLWLYSERWGTFGLGLSWSCFQATW